MLIDLAICMHRKIHHGVLNLYKSMQRIRPNCIHLSPGSMSRNFAPTSHIISIYMQAKTFILTDLTYQYSALTRRNSNDHDGFEPGKNIIARIQTPSVNQK